MPIFFLLLYLRQPVWTVLLVYLFAETSFSFFVVRELRSSKLGYLFPHASFLRIALGVALSAGALSYLPITLTGFGGLLVASVVAVLGTAVSLWLCQPLNREALASIKRMVGGQQGAGAM